MPGKKVDNPHESAHRRRPCVWLNLSQLKRKSIHAPRRQSRVCREDGSRPGGSSWGPSLQSSPAFQGNMRRSISTHAMTFKSRCTRIILNYRIIEVASVQPECIPDPVYPRPATSPISGGGDVPQVPAEVAGWDQVVVCPKERDEKEQRQAGDRQTGKGRPGILE